MATIGNLCSTLSTSIVQGATYSDGSSNVLTMLDNYDTSTTFVKYSSFPNSISSPFTATKLSGTGPAAISIVSGNTITYRPPIWNTSTTSVQITGNVDFQAPVYISPFSLPMFGITNYNPQLTVTTTQVTITQTNQGGWSFFGSLFFWIAIDIIVAGFVPAIIGTITPPSGPAPNVIGQGTGVCYTTAGSLPTSGVAVTSAGAGSIASSSTNLGLTALYGGQYSGTGSLIFCGSVRLAP